MVSGRAFPDFIEINVTLYHRGWTTFDQDRSFEFYDASGIFNFTVMETSAGTRWKRIVASPIYLLNIERPNVPVGYASAMGSSKRIFSCRTISDKGDMMQLGDFTFDGFLSSPVPGVSSHQTRVLIDISILNRTFGIVR